MPAAIETHALTKRYGAARGIEDLTMSVPRGEVFGFLGPNGAGKTTTIRTLLGLLHPTSGSAEVLGLDTRRSSLAIRSRLGNLPGEFAYDERMTGRELIAYAGALRGIGDLRPAQLLAQRLEADLSRRLGELSRGNRQKVGLILALWHDPELLVLDEPTGGLDPLMQEEFHAIVAERRDHGTTVFLSSHDLDEVQRVCDRVGIIREGRLAAVEDVAEMRTRAYRNVTVEFGDDEDLAALAALPVVDGLEVDGRSARFRVRGDLDPVVKALGRHAVRDLEITRPTLEELFLTYYHHGPTA
jgi:beta-exotoxin I transport system ATP-binding protein